MKIIRSAAKLVNLVNLDELPLLHLLVETNRQLLAKKFSFEGVEVQPGGPQRLPKITFAMGSVELNGKQVIIRELSIEERKVLVHIEGRSEEAEKIFGILVEYLKGLIVSETKEFMKPVVVSYESEIIAELEFDSPRLFEKKFVQFVSDRVPLVAAVKHGKPKIKLLELVFSLDYEVTDSELLDYKIGLSSKEFSLAPRPGQPLDKHLFVSRAPVSTADHIGLLEGIESIMK